MLLFFFPQGLQSRCSTSAYALQTMEPRAFRSQQVMATLLKDL